MRISDWSSDVCSSDLATSVEILCSRVPGKDGPITALCLAVNRVAQPFARHRRYYGVDSTYREKIDACPTRAARPRRRRRCAADGVRDDRYRSNEIRAIAQGDDRRRPGAPLSGRRTEEGSEGKGGVSRCRSRWYM